MYGNGTILCTLWWDRSVFPGLTSGKSLVDDWFTGTESYYQRCLAAAVLPDGLWAVSLFLDILYLMSTSYPWGNVYEDLPGRGMVWSEWC